MNRTPRNTGSALLMAVVLLAVVAVGAAAVLRLYHIAFRESARGVKQEVARQLAEAGLDNALARLRVDAAYAGEQNTPLGAGRFSVEVARNGGVFRIVSTGEVVFEGRVMRAAVVRARVELAAGGRVSRLIETGTAADTPRRNGAAAVVAAGIGE